MLTTKVFNCFNVSKGLINYKIELPKVLKEYLNDKPLIDDVDTSITSFLKTYGQPPHLEFEDGDDKDLDEFDDSDDDSVDPEPQPEPQPEPEPEPQPEPEPEPQPEPEPVVKE